MLRSVPDAIKNIARFKIDHTFSCDRI